MGAGALRPARIGPNAVLQMIPPLERRIGPVATAALLKGAGMDAAPDGRSMIPEAHAAALHRAAASALPREAEALARESGEATAAYIVAHRIPRLARVALRVLPARLGERALARAIARHAWTFAGSAEFSLRPGPAFELRGNALARPGAGCTWHAAVFEALMRTLVSRRLRIEETACEGRGAPCCRFELRRC